MIKNLRKGIAACMIALTTMLTAMPLDTLANSNQQDQFNLITSGKITVDGELSDWNPIVANPSTSESVTEWKAAWSANQDTLYFSYSGMSGSEWDYSYLGNNSIEIVYADHSQGNNTKIQFAGNADWISAKNGWYGDIDGANAYTINQAHGNTAGPYTVEASIPVNFFANRDFSITFAGNTIQSSDIVQLDGIEAPKDDEEPIYHGITIDGTYTDWAAVKKYDAVCANPEHSDCLDVAGMVFDGDSVYIYIRENKNAANAGLASNGKYAITTDTGRETIFQLNNDGTVSGIEGVTSAHVGNQWEIAIPASQLAKYQKSISFGLYQQEPFVTGVVNLKSENEVPESKADIVYDGLFGDWDYYPHSRFDYAGPGTSQNVVGAEGALYSDGAILYGHVRTENSMHMQESGGELTGWVRLKFNNDESQMFCFRFALVESDGRINWYPQLSGLQDGTYEFYIFSSDAWHTSNNINDLNQMDQWYGKMSMSIGTSADECEYYIDLNKMAEKLGCNTNDFKTISVNFSRLGDEWITTAGASSGPWLGILISLFVVACVIFFRGRKRRYS